MPDRLDTKALLQTPATRRTVLAGLTGGSAACWIGPTLAGTYADPPIFRTLREQYVILDPIVPLKPAVLNDLNGHKTTIGPARGKLQLVHIWASWCASCREDLIGLQRFQSIADPQILVTTISTDKIDSNRIRFFLKGLGIDHLTVLLDPDGVVVGSDADTSLPRYGLPITYVVTPSGLVAGYITGQVDWSTPDARRLLAYYVTSGSP